MCGQFYQSFKVLTNKIKQKQKIEKQHGAAEKSIYCSLIKIKSTGHTP